MRKREFFRQFCVSLLARLYPKLRTRFSSSERLEVARQVLQVGKAAQRTGLATQAKPASAG